MESEQQEDILRLIVRYLSGLADTVETARLEEWFRMSDDNRDYFEQMSNIWDISDRHRDNINIDTAAALKKVQSGLPGLNQGKSFWYYWQRIAAIFILPLAVGILLWNYLEPEVELLSDNTVYNEVYAAYGTRSSLRLADSTLVWLNSGSSLRYPMRFNEKKRTVFLKGEAYFEVESDVSRPFIVQTQSLKVRATGTKFNINEYEINNESEVTLVTGKLCVSESGKNNPQLISELNPDQHLVFNRLTKEKSVINENSYRYIAWKDGKLIFRNEPLHKVAGKLSMLFNVDIELKGKELQEYRYRATFQDESLEEILKLLKLSSPVNFTEVARQPLPDGSFPKKKVIIYPAAESKRYRPI